MRHRRDRDDYQDRDYDGDRGRDHDDYDRGRGSMLGGMGRSIGRMAVFSIISSIIYGVIGRIFRRF